MKGNIAFGENLGIVPTNTPRWDNYRVGSPEHARHKRFHVMRHDLIEATSARRPGGPGGGATTALTMHNVVQQTQGVDFTVGGTYSGGTSSTLNYQVDGGATRALGGLVMNRKGAWSGKVTGIGVIGNHTITVSVPAPSAVHTTSMTFVVSPGASPVPTPPASFNLLDQVFQTFPTQNIMSMFPIDGNDYNGDCVVAQFAHLDTLWEAQDHNLLIWDAQTVLNQYWTLTGGADSGLNEYNTISTWKNTGLFGGDKIQAFVQISINNPLHCKEAIWMGSGLALAFSWQVDSASLYWSGQEWVPSTNGSGGHAVAAVQYDGDGIGVLTWGNTATGQLQRASWPWLSWCGRYVFACLPDEAKIPTWFDWSLLQADLQMLAN